MSVPPLLNDVLGYLLDITGLLYLPLSGLCILGIAFMVGGHRLPVPGQALINRMFIYFMAAILVFTGIILAMELYATSLDRYYYLDFLIVGITMLAPCVLAIIGLLLARWSRFPIQRARRAPR